MRHIARLPFVIGVLATVVAPDARATRPDPADDSMRRFLSQDDTLHAYQAVRRIEAENGSRRGWLEASTEYAPGTGFRYKVMAEDGSRYIRDKVLRALLDAERNAIAQGELTRSALVPENYVFQAQGVDADGLARVLMSPRRREGMLVAGTMYLRPGGHLVRLEGRLARNPSFWVKNVDIVRTYECIDGAIVPVALESHAEVRFLGEAALRMTYRYSAIDGHPVEAPQERPGDPRIIAARSARE